MCYKSRMQLSKSEINRKFLHLLALLMPMGMFYGPVAFGAPAFLPAVVLGIMSAISIAVEIARRHNPSVQRWFVRRFGCMLRPSERHRTTGSTYIIGGAFLCALCFSDAPHISLMVLTMFIMGDAAAALVGQTCGRIRIGRKSLEGSLACLSVCLVLLMVVFPHLPLLLDAWGGTVPPLLGGFTALAITLLELIALKVPPWGVVDDNLAVAVIAGWIMKIGYPLCACT